MRYVSDSAYKLDSKRKDLLVLALFMSETKAGRVGGRGENSGKGTRLNEAERAGVFGRKFFTTGDENLCSQLEL